MSRHQRQRRSRRRSSPFGRILLGGVIAALLALGGGAVAAVSWVVSTADSAPNISQLRPRIEGQVSEVFASDGTLLGYLSTDVLRKALTQAQQPRLLREATVAIEDRRFFHHGGVDYQGMVRAAISDVFNGSSGTQGASTLTMQLVKNIYLPTQLVDSRSLKYKIVQAKLATELADRRSKNWILTQYLNDVVYGTVGGQSAYGVGAASQMFFDQPNLHKLDLAQMALLAGLPQAPTTYNPFLSPAYARARRSEVLAAMVRSHYISASQAAAANASPLQVHENYSFNTVRQPYVFDYVRQQLIQRLGQKTVDQGGLRVYTSINLQDQADAKQALMANEGQPGDPDATVVTVNPANGEIVAMAQNTTYGLKPGETTVNYATQALRQTGSAFKAFALMTLIHDYDGDPSQTYYDSKFLKPGWLPGYPAYSVQTAEQTYQGVINVTKATTISDNTVFAQLAVDLGIPKVLDMAYAMGITHHQLPVPSIVIGGLNPGVTPLEMADGYATIANGGLHYDPTIINSVTLPSGRSMNLLDTHPVRVFSPGEAYAATQVLKTVIQSGTGTASNYGCPAAGKTGTTTNYTDAWFVGYSPRLATSVWVGYTQEAQQMQDVNGLGPGYGGTLASPIWKDFMAKAAAGFCGDFTPPAVPWTGKPYVGAHSASAVQAYTNTVPFTSPTPLTANTTTATTPATTATSPVVPTIGAAPTPTIPPVSTAPAPKPQGPPNGGQPTATTPSGGSGVG
ncbi:MAG TPA: transglycosylase domain-containing protein [Solirubrobacteraceae bacterium]|nr:transglycosylase domain-containing protein [Solirubrobacteraceae bacterium]